MSTENIITIAGSGLLGLIGAILGVVLRGGKYIEKIDQLEKHDLHGRLCTLEGKFDVRKDFEVFVKRKSPLSLTEEGVNLMINSKAKEIVDGNYKLFFDYVRQSNPQTSYDVQELSLKALDFYADSDMFIPLKNYAFNEGLNYGVLLKVISIYLRDKLLIGLGFKREDIDLTDPNKGEAQVIG